MRLVLFLVFGLVIGAVSGIVLPHRTPRSWAMAMVIGGAGSMVGALLASALRLGEGSSRAGFAVSALGALGWVAIYELLLHRASRRALHRDRPQP